VGEHDRTHGRGTRGRGLLAALNLALHTFVKP
jgi:hypothetical protein